LTRFKYAFSEALSFETDAVFTRLSSWLLFSSQYRQLTIICQLSKLRSMICTRMLKLRNNRLKLTKDIPLSQLVDSNLVKDIK
jgi:hypothetical protein